MLVSAADDSQLRGMYDEQRRLLAVDPDRASLGLVLACGSEMSRRRLGLDPRPGQLLVAASLAQGFFAEFPTGEGKTLAVALAALWLAPRHGNVHVATANEYLAGRDAASVSPLFDTAGLTVTHVADNQPDRAERYRADVVYGTLARFAGDCLSDGLRTSPVAMLQPRTGALVVDEADAVLIDGATDPFSLTGTDRAPRNLDRFWSATVGMHEGVHYRADHQRRTVWLEPSGVALAESVLGPNLYERPRDVQWLHAALLVRTFFRADHEYVLVEGRPVLLDPVTGRPRPKARLSLGLQPMLETSVGVRPGPIPVTFARTSTRAFTARYRHLCGTGGTLATDKVELRAVYGRETVVIPPHLPSRLVKHPDRVYVTRLTKLAAILSEVSDRHRSGQPVLIGTGSVEDAEALSTMLHANSIPHEMVTARDHHREADIVVAAGRTGAVTVAARFAGRGVDIPVDPDVPGGLCVVATERFPSQREDRQLSGRTARNGAPGEALVFVSCEDDLLRVHGGGALDAAVASLRGSTAEEVQVPGLGNLLTRAQQQMEAFSAARRAETLAWDDAFEGSGNRFRTWRDTLLTGGLEGALTGLYLRRVTATAAPWRRMNRERLGGCWPDDVALPDRSGREWAVALGHQAYSRVSARAAAQVGTDRVEQALKALGELIMEVADSEWAAFLADAETVATVNADADARVIARELHHAEEAFWERLDRRTATVVWRASFGADPRGVRPGGDGSPSPS